MTDPTPAEIETAARKHYLARTAGRGPQWNHLDEYQRADELRGARAVLRAVLPGHDTRLRAAVVGGSDGATRAAAIARHATGGDHG